MEEEEEGPKEGEQGEEKTREEPSSVELSRASSNASLLSEPRDVSEGLVNPAFSLGDCRPSSPSGHSSQSGRTVKSSGWACPSSDRPYGACASLSSSVENIPFSGAPLTLMRGSYPLLNEPRDKESLSDGKSFRDDTSLLCSKSKGNGCLLQCRG